MAYVDLSIETVDLSMETADLYLDYWTGLFLDYSPKETGSERVLV